MANNIFTGPNATVAKDTKTFAELGLTNTNTSIVYEVGEVLKSWMPSRALNPIAGITSGKGYYFVAKTAIDLSNFFTPPFPAGGSDTPASFTNDIFLLTQ